MAGKKIVRTEVDKDWESVIPTERMLIMKSADEDINILSFVFVVTVELTLVKMVNIFSQ